MKKIKKILKSLLVQIAIGVISTIIVNLIIEKITNFNIIYFFIEKILELLNFIWTFLNFKLAIWIYILISTVIVTIFVVSLNIRNKNIKETEPDFFKYCEDKYKDRVKFRWEYQKNYDGKYTIINFIPICECGCQLNERNQIGNRHFGTKQYVCPKCEKEYGNVLSYEEMESFEKILISNVRSGEYKKIINNREGE